MLGSRTYAWARATAVATLFGNVALWIGYFALLPPAGAPLYNSFSSGMWAIMVGSATGVAFVASVVLLLEYRARSRDGNDPERGSKSRRVAFLLAPTFLHALAFGGAVLYAFGRS